MTGTDTRRPVMGTDTTPDLAALRSDMQDVLYGAIYHNRYDTSAEAMDALLPIVERYAAAKTANELEAGETRTESEIVRDKRRVLEHLRTARKFMPYLHESMSAYGAVKLLGSRDRAQRALVALVQDGKVRYLENCSPDHYQAYAEMQGGPWVPVEDEAGA